MNYVSGVKWNRNKSGELQSYYHIKSAIANDPFEWERKGKVAIDFKENETNIARPSVIKIGNKYFMWYSYIANGNKYRIGMAVSSDAKNWQRKDNLSGIHPGDQWTKKMICYPSIFKKNGCIYMLYNGDDFGLKGFGLAKLKN